MYDFDYASTNKLNWRGCIGHVLSASECERAGFSEVYQLHSVVSACLKHRARLPNALASPPARYFSIESATKRIPKGKTPSSSRWLQRQKRARDLHVTEPTHRSKLECSHVPHILLLESPFPMWRSSLHEYDCFPSINSYCCVCVLCRTHWWLGHM